MVYLFSIWFPYNRRRSPRWLSGKESACQCRKLRRHRFDPWSGISPGGGNGNSLRYSFLEKFHGHRSIVGYSPWGRKELDRTEQLSLHRLPYDTSISICCISISCVQNSAKYLCSLKILVERRKEGRKEEVEEELLFPFLWLNFWKGTHFRSHCLFLALSF